MDRQYEEILARPLVSVDDAIKVAPVSRNGMYALIKQGKIKSVRLGGRVFIPGVVLRAMVAA